MPQANSARDAGADRRPLYTRTMRIVLFLLDTLFFFLVAAALLRAWMNLQRVQMSVQPGRFVMAITDWVVKPVRRILPRVLAQSRIDWGSLVAAELLALLHTLLTLLLLQGGALLEQPDWLVAVPLMSGVFVLRTILQGLMVLLIVYAILSWVQQQSPVMGMLDRLLSPLLRPIRRVVPLVGGVDLSVLLLIVLLQVGLMVIG